MVELMRDAEAVARKIFDWLLSHPPNRLVYGAILIRLCLVAFGEWQDSHMPVKYTDVDYGVYTDAARLVVDGRSPYERTTFRYTPVLAWILTPTVLPGCAVFGKLLFVAADIAIGALIYSSLKLRRLPPHAAARYAAVWLLHPFSINISTRGNADALVGVLVLGSLHLLLRRRIRASAVLYGLSVHFKLYPIVYALSFYLFLDEVDYGGEAKPSIASSIAPPVAAVRRFFSARRLEFAAVSAGSCLLLSAACFILYGNIFLYETYLYHFGRKDNRHNFSIFFYELYLHYGREATFVESLAGFAPQLLLIIFVSVRYRADLPFALFLHTLSFVAFNKVCTAQYFVWYLALLPLVLPCSRMRWRWTGASLVALWFLTELHWLFWAYRLEFLGENTFLPLWVAGCMFFLANVTIFVQMVRHHKEGKVFERGELVPMKLE